MIPKTNGTNVKSGLACPDRLPRLPRLPCLPCLPRLPRLPRLPCLPCLPRLPRLPRLPPGEALARLPSSLPAAREPGPCRRPLLRLSLRQTLPERLRFQKTGPTVPGIVGKCLPGANQGPTAPGNEENRLPGAKRLVFAPGREETRSPGAEIGQCAPGSAKGLVVARSGGKQGCRSDDLSWARVFPKGRISALGKHGHPAGLFYCVLLFPTTYICRCRHSLALLSPHSSLPRRRSMMRK